MCRNSAAVKELLVGWGGLDFCCEKINLHRKSTKFKAECATKNMPILNMFGALFLYGCRRKNPASILTL